MNLKREGKRTRQGIAEETKDAKEKTTNKTHNNKKQKGEKIKQQTRDRNKNTTQENQ